MSFREVDPRFDRLLRPDDRNLPIDGVVPDRVVENRMWYQDALLVQHPLDNGACGFAVAHELSTTPGAVWPVSDAFALALHREAAEIDAAERGSSLLSACKVAKRRGYIEQYRWCTSTSDVLRALSSTGPVVVGTKWTQEMHMTGAEGRIKFNALSRYLGDFAFLVKGFDNRASTPDPFFRIRTSLGLDYGWHGDTFIGIDDFDKLIDDSFEAVVLIRSRHADAVKLDPPVARGDGSGPKPGSDRDAVADESPAVNLDAMREVRETVPRAA